MTTLDDATTGNSIAREVGLAIGCPAWTPSGCDSVHRNHDGATCYCLEAALAVRTRQNLELALAATRDHGDQ